MRDHDIRYVRRKMELGMCMFDIYQSRTSDEEERKYRATRYDCNLQSPRSFTLMSKPRIQRSVASLKISRDKLLGHGVVAA